MKAFSLYKSKPEKFQLTPLSSGNSQRLLLVILLILISPYFYLSFFNHPVADDYSAALPHHSSNYWAEQYYQYIYWNGLYSYNLLFFMNPTVFHNTSFYKIAPLIILISSIASICYFLHAITKHIFSSQIILNAGILFMLLYLFQMPSLAEGIYWYSGSVEYQAGILVSLIYFGLLCNYFNNLYLVSKRTHLALTGIILVFAIGFSEVIMLLLISFHLIIFILALANKVKIQSEWWIFLTLCFAFSLTVIVAPGNIHRNSFFPGNHRLVHSLLYTILQIMRFAFNWISNLPFLISTFLFASYAIKHRDQYSFPVELSCLKPVFFPLALIGMVFICIFPAYYMTGILGQHRTVNAACFFFTLFWFTAIAVLAKRYGNSKIANVNEIVTLFNFNKRFRFLLILALFIGLAATKNGQDCLMDILCKKANRFDTEMKNRNKILENPGNKRKLVHLKPLNTKPASLFVLDLNSDTASWVNSSQAQYYGVQGIICSE